MEAAELRLLLSLRKARLAAARDMEYAPKTWAHTQTWNCHTKAPSGPCKSHPELISSAASRNEVYSLYYLYKLLQILNKLHGTNSYLFFFGYHTFLFQLHTTIPAL